MKHARAHARFRFSVAGLMVLIVFVAIVGSLARDLQSLVNGVWIVVTISIFVGVPIVLLIPRIQPFGIGFGAMAGGYLIALSSPLGSYLPTTLAFESLNPHYDVEWESSLYDERAEKQQEDARSTMIAAGQLLTTLALGLAGGSAFHLLAGRKIDDDPVVDSLVGRLLNPDHAGRIRDGVPRD